jgi:hypothetical protein
MMFRMTSRTVAVVFLAVSFVSAGDRTNPVDTRSAEIQEHGHF